MMELHLGRCLVMNIGLILSIANVHFTVELKLS